MQSPIGNLYLQIEEGKLRYIHFVEPKGFKESTIENAHDNQVFQQTKKQLNEYFAGERISFDIPLDAKGTSFQQRVWGKLIDIPYGQTISYQLLANQIDNPKACQAVGQANRKNPLPIVVPCHRVIGKDNSLKGYAGSLTPIKEFLLQLESKKYTQIKL